MGEIPEYIRMKGKYYALDTDYLLRGLLKSGEDITKNAKEFIKNRKKGCSYLLITYGISPEEVLTKEREIIKEERRKIDVEEFLAHGF